jgi:hypothetical protein
MRFPARWVVPFIAGGLAMGCNSSEPSDPGTVSILTDAASYTLEGPEDGAAVFMTPRLRNGTGGDIVIPVCVYERETTVMLYERRNEGGDWEEVAGIDCSGMETQDLVLPPGESPVPPGRWRPANEPGTYRLKIPWHYLSEAAIDTAYSASYAVQPAPGQ